MLFMTVQQSLVSVFSSYIFAVLSQLLLNMLHQHAFVLASNFFISGDFFVLKTW